MRYLTGRPFTVAVGNGKITAEEWARRVGTVENAAIDRSGRPRIFEELADSRIPTPRKVTPHK